MGAAGKISLLRWPTSTKKSRNSVADALFPAGGTCDNSPKVSLHVEYLYRHMSNAHMGIQDPGVDQAVIRLSMSRRW